MKLRLYIIYLIKYYRISKLKLFVSLLALIICYLTLEVVFSFSSIIENNSQNTFAKYFAHANYIISSPEGIIFDNNGNLLNTPALDTVIVGEFEKQFSRDSYNVVLGNFVEHLNEKEIKYIIITDRSLHKNLIDFCKRKDIKIFNSFYSPTKKVTSKALMFDVNGTGNRFSIFSFQNQISSFILGTELSSSVGYISRLLFIFSFFFTLYISLLFFQERKNEFATLIIQGYIDKNLKIIFLDCILQNLISFFASILLLVPILLIFTRGSDDFQSAIKGVLYILPYLPIMVIIQLLLFLNRTTSYASNLK